MESGSKQAYLAVSGMVTGVIDRDGQVLAVERFDYMDEGEIVSRCRWYRRD